VTLTAVTAEDLFVDDGRNWETVKTIRECFPQLYVIPPLACFAETQNSNQNMIYKIKYMKQIFKHWR